MASYLESIYIAISENIVEPLPVPQAGVSEFSGVRARLRSNDSHVRATLALVHFNNYREEFPSDIKQLEIKMHEISP